ncbi:unnamed protein product, partial [Tetraodon nigroviridis]
SVMMKPFLSFPVEAMSTVGLFSNFNMMDPVQKAVINHTFGVTFLPTRKQIISCSVCQLRFNSDSQAEAHYKGSRHAKKIKSQEARATARLPVPAEPCGSSSSPAAPPLSAADSSCQHTERAVNLPHPAPPLLLPAPSACLLPPAPPPPPPPPLSHVSSQDASLSAESEEEKAKKLLYCSLCKVAVNSLSQLEAHNAAKLKNGSSSTAKGSGLQNKTFHCQICDVHVNSEIQLKQVETPAPCQHISSRRHKDRVAGKPSKPKYSPYNKQPRGSIACIQHHSPPPPPCWVTPPPPSPRPSPPTRAPRPPRPSLQPPSCVLLLGQSELTRGPFSSRRTSDNIRV